MKFLVDILFTRIWWSYQRDAHLPYTEPYHWFNLAEGAIWCVFGALVLKRYCRHGHSKLELCYALAFFTFGLTDFREAWSTTSWLLWLKLINLICLLLLRRRVMRDYPSAKLF